MEFSRQEHCSGLLFPPPRDLPNPGIQPGSPASPRLASGFFTVKPPLKLIMGYWPLFFFKSLCILDVLIFGHWWINAVCHFSSVTQSCPTLCDPMDYSVPGFPVHNQLLELTQTRVHWVSNAVHPSLSSPSPPTFNLSQQQGLFKWVSSSRQVPKVLEFQLQHQSFQWIFRTDFP